jgi:MerR family mercuric resistance operon transcriptional regulator
VATRSEGEVLRIGELATAAGVGVETIRYYERRGLLPEPYRRPSGYREYPPDAVDRVRAIKRAQRMGFTLAEIEQLLRPRGLSGRADVQARASAKLDELEGRARELDEARRELELLVSLGCDRLVGCRCGQDICPVAHDERQETALAEPAVAETPPSRPHRSRRAWALPIATGAAACAACLVPLLMAAIGGAAVGAVAREAAEAAFVFALTATALVLAMWWRRGRAC